MGLHLIHSAKKAALSRQKEGIASALRDLLAQAEAGEITDICITVELNGEYTTMTAAMDKLKMIGAMMEQVYDLMKP